MGTSTSMQKKIPGMQGAAGGFEPHISTVDEMSTISSKAGDKDVRKGSHKSSHKKGGKY